MDLAAQDRVQFASAMRHAGIQMVDAHAWNDALKAFQLGQVTLTDDRSEASVWLTAETAMPLAAMGFHDAAREAITKARSHPLPDPFDQADMDGLTSSVYMRLGQVDAAERFAASSVRRWASARDSRRDSVEGDIHLASLHARAGEADTVPLAQRAISSVAQLRSVRARVKLTVLAEALEARPDSTSRDLAIHARRVSDV